MRYNGYCDRLSSLGTVHWGLWWMVLPRIRKSWQCFSRLQAPRLMLLSVICQYQLTEVRKWWRLTKRQANNASLPLHALLANIKRRHEHNTQNVYTTWACKSNTTDNVECFFSVLRDIIEFILLRLQFKFLFFFITLDHMIASVWVNVNHLMTRSSPPNIHLWRRFPGSKSMPAGIHPAPGTEIHQTDCLGLIEFLCTSETSSSNSFQYHYEDHS